MNDSLMHHGIKGQIWGIRRYQNEDGSRTDIGREHENELKRQNRAMISGSFSRSAPIRSSGTTYVTENSIRGSLKRRDGGTVSVEEDRGSTRSSNSGSSIAGSFVRNKANAGTIKSGLSATVEVLSESDVSKPLSKNSNSGAKIDNGKRILMSYFSKKTS